jgi:glutaredoxin 3
LGPISAALQRTLQVDFCWALQSYAGVTSFAQMSVPVEVYITDYCPYCTRAKDLLKRRGIAFTVIDVTHDDDKRAWLVKETGRRTVPQIFIGGKAVGGSDDIHELDRKGELTVMAGVA